MSPPLDHAFSPAAAVGVGIPAETAAATAASPHRKKLSRNQRRKKNRRDRERANSLGSAASVTSATSVASAATVAASEDFGMTPRSEKKSKKKKRRTKGPRSTEADPSPSSSGTVFTSPHTPSSGLSASITSSAGKVGDGTSGGKKKQSVTPNGTSSSAGSGSHLRSISFVYPRSQSPGGSGSKPSPFVFGGSTPAKNKKKKEPDHISDGGSTSPSPRPRSATEESIDDILYPERKAKRERERMAAAAMAAADEIVDGKKKKKRKRKSSIGSVDESLSSTRTGAYDVDLDEEDRHEGAPSTPFVDKAHLVPESDSTATRDETGTSKKRKKDKEERKKHKDHRRRSDSMGSVGSETSSLSAERQSKKKRKHSEDESDTSRRHNQDIEKDSGSKKRGADRLHKQLSGISVDDAVRDMDGRRPRSNSTDGELNLPRRGLCDEHAVLESHRWDVSRMYGANGSAVKSILRSDPLGFVNLGNTCFLNSTLQCLVHLPTFCQCVLELPPHTKGMGGGKGKKFTNIMRTLLRNAHNLDVISMGRSLQRGTLTPKDIVRALPMLGESGRGYKFRPGRQEDAHEFLVHLLDAMNDGELKAAGINQRISGWRDRLPIPRLDETTFIHRIFGGYLRSQVRCTKCGYKSNTYDPFLDLALEVNKRDSVVNAFRDFTREETLDVQNQWKCSGCKKRVCAKKQLTVFRPPLSLVIQLKRFTFGAGGMMGGLMQYGSGRGFGYGHYAGKGMGMKGRGGSKITKPIGFPAILELPLSDKRTCSYELSGVVVHVGGSATSGHYTAYVKKAQGKGAPPKWFHMDDSYVEQVTEKTVLRQKHAYVLFYCRKEVDMALPSPPPRRASMTAKEAKLSGAERARARADSFTSLSSSIESPTPRKSSTKKSKSAKTTPRPLSSSSSSDSDSSSSGSDSSSSSDSDRDSSARAGISSTRQNLDASLAKAASGKQSIKSASAAVGNARAFMAQDESFLSSDDEYTKEASKKEDTNHLDAKQSKQMKTIRATTAGSKIEVNTNRAKAKAWRSQSIALKDRRRDGSTDLLGDRAIGGWNDGNDGDDSRGEDCHTSFLSNKKRKKAVKEMDSKARSRKREMHIEKWDMALDEGRKKKVKSKDQDDGAYSSPSFNSFQRIQQSMQQMSKGKAKGYHDIPPTPARRFSTSGQKMKKNRGTYGRNGGRRSF